MISNPLKYSTASRYLKICPLKLQNNLHVYKTGTTYTEEYKITKNSELQMKFLRTVPDHISQWFAGSQQSNTYELVFQ